MSWLLSTSLYRQGILLKIALHFTVDYFALFQRMERRKARETSIVYKQF